MVLARQKQAQCHSLLARFPLFTHLWRMNWYVFVHSECLPYCSERLTLKSRECPQIINFLGLSERDSKIDGFRHYVCRIL